MSYDHFGNLLTQGLKSIAALEKTELTEVQLELGRDIGVSVWTIYKWRKGTSIPQDDRTIAMLARASVQRGRMDRHWLTDFLRHTVYSDKQALTDELCPGDSAPPPVRHNLPRRQHVKLIGRERELGDILSFLSPRHRVGVVCISGGGGVGKTALALEISHLCKDAVGVSADERFEAIVWVTAKTAELMPAGQVPRQPTFTDLDSVYRAIGELLDIPAIFQSTTHAERSIQVARYLAEHRVLLMLDNLEDVDDQELMVFLRDLPAPSKAIVTTRHRVDVAVPIYLHMLDEAMALELAHVECERTGVALTDAQIRMLLRRTGGLPLAIIRTIGRMAWRGSSVETELQHLMDARNQIYDFCFTETVNLIRGSAPYHLFMALALFVKPVQRDAIGVTAGCTDVFARDEGLSDLEVLSLSTKDKDRFGLEPLTHTQAQAELSQNPDYESAARERWVDWYMRYTATYGGRDGQEMQVRYDHLDEDWDNILAVMQWCIDQNHYDDVGKLWANVRDFTHVYGYWSDRLHLLKWLIAEAERRGEWDTAILAMYDRAFTLLLIRLPTQLDEADALLKRCWSLREYVAPAIQARIASLAASLCIRQGDTASAKRWLDEGETLLQTATPTLSALEMARERTSLLYDVGETLLVSGDYGNAQRAFEEMLQQAQAGDWQRSVLYAQNWLAYTAVLQGNAARSEQFLQMGWSVANRIKEKRLNAFYKRTFAHYHRSTGNQAEAQRWAEDAFDSFERLGMLPEMREMQEMMEAVTSNE